MSLALSSANPQYPAHARMHHHHQQQPHPYVLAPESNSPIMANEPVSNTKNNNSSGASPIEPLHPSLFTASNHQQQQHHHYNQTSYHQTPYQAPSPPYSHRSNSTDLSQKPSLPFPTKTTPSAATAVTTPSTRHHPYAPSPPRSSHRGLSYSPPTTLPPLTLPPLSPQSPMDSSNHYHGLPASYHHNPHHDHRSHTHQFAPHDHQQQQPFQRRPSSGSDDRSHSYRRESPRSSGSPSPSPSAYHHPHQQQNGHTHEPSDGGSAAPPLSANDRRERNKAASAKYRAKKHCQSGEMKGQISVLQDQNNVLTRQLDETRTENIQLKNLVEKLKGRLVAEKVLKRLREVGRERRGGNGNASKRVAVESDSDDFVGDDYDVDVDEDDDLRSVVGEDDEDEIHVRQEQKRSKQWVAERKPKSRRRAAPRSDDETQEF